MKENEIGALWLNESKSGSKYMSGVVEVNGVKQKIIVFKNNYKQEEKHPDYRILKSEPKQQQAFTGPEEFQDDIPF